MLLLGDDQRVVLSAGDLRRAATCEFAVVAGLDVLRGRRPRAEVVDDPVHARVAELGVAHEQAELRRLTTAHPGQVVQLARPGYTPDALAAAMAETVTATSGGARVVYQATVFDGGFVGHVDFLEHTLHGWVVSDTKLARSEDVAALLQVGAYASVLADAGVPVAPVARLVLGDGEVVDRPLEEVVAVYARRRAHLESVLAEHDADRTAAVWGDPRWLACGRCEVCEPEVKAARDLLLVAGMRGPTRARLLEAGVTTIDDLAARTAPVPDVRPATLERLAAQARLQLVQDADPGGTVSYELVDTETLRRMPPPSDGDLFFDFEGDPLWHERGSGDWGLEYLFGMLEVDSGSPRFRAFWAHDRAQERQALVDFVEHVRARRRRWPGLHIYHYAPYETSALLRLAARHGVCEDDVDQLLRDEVFVDLYAVVRSALRVSQRSYSIKKLEPLYMDAREEEVQGGAESIVAYHEYEQAVVDGRADTADARLGDIAAYNEKDCRSTLLLRDWLLARRREEWGDEPTPPPPEPVEPELGERRLAALALEAAVRSEVDSVPVADRTPEEQAVALVGSSVLFHAREDKPAWQEHFERLRLPVGEWRPADGVFVVDRVEVVDDWHLPPRARKPRRRLRLHGEPARNVALPAGAKVAAVYAVPAPDGMEADPLHAHAKNPATVTVLDAEDTVTDSGWVRQVLDVEELQPGAAAFDMGPVALVPDDHVRTDNLDDALAEIAEQVLATGRVPESAGGDLLLRHTPRLRGGETLPVPGGPRGYVDAITEALRAMDDSYLAVQGPPGTGKTYVGAHVVARLVDEGWAVGVTAQSHAAVENVLSTLVASAGAPAGQVGKAGARTPDAAWTALAKADELAGFAAEHRAAGRGYVIGGTAWDLTNPRRVERGQLDLLVVDEAGQLSLAKTLAVSVAARRLLLLGDPQQLPGVTTGVHAEPVDRAALVWLADDAPVLPPALGYFLATTWRMHPALTEVVSDLAYAGRLESHAQVTAARTLGGVDPGLHVRLVDHLDNSTHSPEEAAEVVRLVRDLLGRTWEDPSETDTSGRPVGPRVLTERDVVVITPYNHQVSTIQRALLDAGLVELADRVGTVDRFQGQEAPVAILSMAASSHTDVSRGMGFLLDRHRLNVAISRAQYATYLVRSRVLTDFAPRSADELVALGAFLRLGEPDSPPGIRHPGGRPRPVGQPRPHPVGDTG
ncbi:TM0106 family RecB-like putative nuclease [Phycicoccus sp. CSK15P-2]|uniref:TM0106 family RecB-like putative nuclease n=1 Tax=Phycicoccus sp. CSK15P-2 TaxID=2807627 RepID=UPI0019520A03|nr:bifunctional RecB family nuclease/DEAD/DEAH box helicase [Phycicoccus sp. CSK15P-2]MBM6402667.1 TM0106 family RecB-like putative nuclease [Phycicoccus sp. CSK15P-2]